MEGGRLHGLVFAESLTGCRTLPEIRRAHEGDHATEPDSLRPNDTGRIVDGMVRGIRSAQITRPARPVARRAVVSVRWAVTAVRHLLRVLPASLVTLLLAFHAWLLVTSISSGRVLDVDVALRWVAGFGLSAAFVALWRLGAPLVRSRKAVVLWVLVVVLHAHAVASTPTALEADSPTTQTLISLAVQLGGPLASAFGLVLLAGLVRAARPVVERRLVLVLTSDTLAHVRAGGICIAAPRPPPALA